MQKIILPLLVILLEFSFIRIKMTDLNKLFILLKYRTNEHFFIKIKPNFVFYGINILFLLKTLRTNPVMQDGRCKGA
jgi:hypothetical protein